MYLFVGTKTTNSKIGYSTVLILHEHRILYKLHS